MAWQDPTKKSFTIPKKKQTHVENVNLTKNIDATSRVFQEEWLPVLQRNFLNPSSARHFSYSRFRLIENNGLAQKFEEKIRSFKSDGNHTQQNVSQILGFLQVYSEKEAEDIATHGLKIGHALDCKLGLPSKGVCLSKHSDIFSGAPLMDGSSGILVVFKVVKGRVKLVAPNSEGMEPVPGYDCHMTNRATGQLAKGSSPLENLNSVRMYLYEYEDCAVKDWPSSVLPVAFVTYKYSETGELPRSLGDNISWIGSLRMNQPDGRTVWSCHDCRLSSHYTRVKPFGLSKNLIIKQLVPIQKAQEWSVVRELSSNALQGMIYKKREIKLLHQQFASCWRLSLASTNQRENADFVQMIEKMKRSKVAGLCWLKGSTSILVFPPGDLSSILGIPHFNDMPSLHCLIVSYRSILTGLSYPASKDPYEAGSHDLIPPLGSTLRPDTRMVFAFRQMHINPAGGGQLGQMLMREGEESVASAAPSEDETAHEDLGPEVLEEEDMILDEELFQVHTSRTLLENPDFPDEENDSATKGMEKPVTTKSGYGAALAAGTWKPIQKSKDPRIQKRVQLNRAKKEAQNDGGSIKTEYSIATEASNDISDTVTEKSYLSNEQEKEDLNRKRLRDVEDGTNGPLEKKPKTEENAVSGKDVLREKLLELKTLGTGPGRMQQDAEHAATDQAAAADDIVVFDAPDSPMPNDELAMESAAYSEPPPRISLEGPSEQDHVSFSPKSRSSVVVQEPVVTSTTPTRQKVTLTKSGITKTLSATSVAHVETDTGLDLEQAYKVLSWLEGHDFNSCLDTAQSDTANGKHKTPTAENTSKHSEQKTSQETKKSTTKAAKNKAKPVTKQTKNITIEPLVSNEADIDAKMETLRKEGADNPGLLALCKWGSSRAAGPVDNVDSIVEMSERELYLQNQRKRFAKVQKQLDKTEELIKNRKEAFFGIRTGPLAEPAATEKSENNEPEEHQSPIFHKPKSRSEESKDHQVLNKVLAALENKSEGEVMQDCPASPDEEPVAEIFGTPASPDIDDELGAEQSGKLVIAAEDSKKSSMDVSVDDGSAIHIPLESVDEYDQELDNAVYDDQFCFPEEDMWEQLQAMDEDFIVAMNSINMESKKHSSRRSKKKKTSELRSSAKPAGRKSKSERNSRDHKGKERRKLRKDVKDKEPDKKKKSKQIASVDTKQHATNVKRQVKNRSQKESSHAAAKKSHQHKHEKHPTSLKEVSSISDQLEPAQLAEQIHLPALQLLKSAAQHEKIRKGSGLEKMLTSIVSSAAEEMYANLDFEIPEFREACFHGSEQDLSDAVVEFQNTNPNLQNELEEFMESVVESCIVDTVLEIATRADPFAEKIKAFSTLSQTIKDELGKCPNVDALVAAVSSQFHDAVEELVNTNHPGLKVDTEIGVAEFCFAAVLSSVKTGQSLRLSVSDDNDMKPDQHPSVQQVITHVWDSFCEQLTDFKFPESYFANVVTQNVVAVEENEAYLSTDERILSIANKALLKHIVQLYQAFTLPEIGYDTYDEDLQELADEFDDGEFDSAFEAAESSAEILNMLEGPEDEKWLSNQNKQFDKGFDFMGGEEDMLQLQLSDSDEETKDRPTKHKLIEPEEFGERADEVLDISTGVTCVETDLAEFVSALEDEDTAALLSLNVPKSNDSMDEEIIAAQDGDVIDLFNNDEDEQIIAAQDEPLDEQDDDQILQLNLMQPISNVGVMQVPDSEKVNNLLASESADLLDLVSDQMGFDNVDVMDEITGDVLMSDSSTDHTLSVDDIVAFEAASFCHSVDVAVSSVVAPSLAASLNNLLVSQHSKFIEDMDLIISRSNSVINEAVDLTQVCEINAFSQLCDRVLEGHVPFFSNTLSDNTNTETFIDEVDSMSVDADGDNMDMSLFPYMDNVDLNLVPQLSLYDIREKHLSWLSPTAVITAMQNDSSGNTRDILMEERTSVTAAVWQNFDGEFGIRRTSTFSHKKRKSTVGKPMGYYIKLLEKLDSEEDFMYNYKLQWKHMIPDIPKQINVKQFLSLGTEQIDGDISNPDDDLVVPLQETDLVVPLPQRSVPDSHTMPSPDSAGPLGSQMSGIIVPDDTIFNRASDDQVVQVLEALYHWKQMGSANWSIKLHSQVVLQLAQAKKNLNPESPASKRLSAILQNLTKFRRFGIVELLQNHACDSAPRAPKEYLPCVNTLAALAKFSANAGFHSNHGNVIFLSNMDSACAAAEDFKKAGIMVMSLSKFIENFMDIPSGS